MQNSRSIVQRLVTKFNKIETMSQLFVTRLHYALGDCPDAGCHAVSLYSTLLCNLSLRCFVVLQTVVFYSNTN